MTNHNENNNQGRARSPRGGYRSVFGQFSDYSPMDEAGLKLSPLEALRAALFVQISAHRNPEMIVGLVPVNEPNMVAPALAVCVYLNDAMEKGVGVHILLVEEEAVPLTPRTVRELNGASDLTVERLLSEVIDPTYIAAVMNEVRTSLDTGEAKLLDAGCRVIRAGTDYNNVEVAHALAFDATLAANQVLAPYLTDDTIELQLDEVDRDVRFHLEIETGPRAISDIQGIPLRSDVRLRLMMSMPSLMRSAPGRIRPVEFGTVHGFFDFITLPENVFLPRFVITELALNPPGSNSVSAQLLLIAMVTTLAEENRWCIAFLRAFAQGSMRSLASIDERLEQASDLSEGIKILTERCHPGLVISMDTSVALDSAWRFDVWAAAASRNNEYSRNAFSRIWQAANLLTADRFSEHCKATEVTTLLETENNAIPLGYFKNHSDVRQDIREVDELLVATLTKNDPAVREHWRETYLAAGLPLESRYAQRLQIIRGIVGEVQLLDIGTRVTFGSSFLRALQYSIRDIGFTVTLPQEYLTARPLTYEWDTVFGGENGSSGLFQQPYQGTGYVPSFSTRPRWK